MTKKEERRRGTQTSPKAESVRRQAQQVPGMPFSWEEYEEMLRRDASARRKKR